MGIRDLCSLWYQELGTGYWVISSLTRSVTLKLKQEPWIILKLTGSQCRKPEQESYVEAWEWPSTPAQNDGQRFYWDTENRITVVKMWWHKSVENHFQFIFQLGYNCPHFCSIPKVEKACRVSPTQFVSQFADLNWTVDHQYFLLFTGICEWQCNIYAIVPLQPHAILPAFRCHPSTLSTEFFTVSLL